MNSIVSPKKLSGREESKGHITQLRSKNKAAQRIRKYRQKPAVVVDFTRDWTTAQFHKPKYVIPRLEQRHDSLPVRAHFVSPKRHSLTERELAAHKGKGRLLRRKQIMVEFTPKRLIHHSEETPIDIVPLTELRRGRRKHPALERTMHIERLEDVSISPGAQSCLAHM